MGNRRALRFHDEVPLLNVHHFLMEAAPLAPTRSRNQTQSIIWTPEEDAHLVQIMAENPSPSWCMIIPFFPGKTAQQIAGRWEKVLNPHLIKGSWTREEDEIIIDFVQKNGPRNWVKLALLLPGRIGKQCRERWTNHLNPNVAKKTWTETEDKLLIELHEQFGNQWTKIATFFEGRSDNCVKNRWNSSLKRRIERVARGEPAFRKRGRKPKAQKEEETHISECSSPIQKDVGPITTIGIFTSRLMKGGMFEHESSPLKSLQQNRIDLQMLMDRNVKY